MLKSSSREEAESDSLVVAGQPVGRPLLIYTIIGVLLLVLLSLISLLRKPAADSHPSRNPAG